MKPTVLVLFGITGDLARNKVLPAIYHLIKDGHAPTEFSVIGISRQPVSALDVVETLENTIGQSTEKADSNILAHLVKSLTMIQMDPQQADDYKNLIAELDTNNRIFAYLSLPPQTFEQVTRNLAHCGLGHANLLIEKPFGYDLSSAQQLISHTGEHYPEEQLYRIDHYLAKEMARNMLEYRRHHEFLDTVWNGRHIESIEVTATEAIGIAGRANFYDDIGALRDVIQSHLLQLLAVTMMEIPAQVSSESLHGSKQVVLSRLNAAEASNAKRGQYIGYRDEVANSDSTTETYAELKIASSDPIWQDTALLIKTGKAMANKYTGIQITFVGGHDSVEFRIQPGEGIVTKLDGKRFGLPASIDTAVNLPTRLEAYERVLIDALNGDRTLFATDTEVLESWRIVQPVLTAWQSYDNDLIMYPIGAKIV